MHARGRRRGTGRRDGRRDDGRRRPADEARLIGGQLGGTAPSPARRILDERYARGEIDEEEYRRRRAGLT
ncbi:SHOCT domain-containing protein [Micromonospora sp. ATA51]|uniref:SHOCT domain-containing protein n=1 Tax=Micromonospora sp. ATA51 TaxID=2806098 RepID=UPI001EE467E7|nr:SHOCT domain-containing protein [Micromonospora sp. ATA51]